MLWQASAPDSSNSAEKTYTLLIAYIFKACISDCIPYYIFIIKPFFREANSTRNHRFLIRPLIRTARVIMSAKG